MNPAVTYYLQCWHDEVGGGVNPVCSLHSVGASDSGNPRITIQVDIKLKLADEVKRLQIIISRLVVSTGILNLLYNT